MFIFDSSTLILLARIELLPVFLNGYKTQVMIPRKVESECCGIKKTLDALMIQKAVEESRIHVRQVKDQRFVTKLEEDFGLGQGEAEAIALAVSVQAKSLGIDDKNGINACKVLGISFVTAPGILIGCFEQRLVRREEALLKLGLLGKYGRYKKEILQHAAAHVESRP